MSRALPAFLVALVVATPTPALAWSDHDLLTREILRSNTWLNQYRNIKVKKWAYDTVDKGPYNPDFQPVFIDKLEGDTTNAREILIRYVDEPDLGMDDQMNLSPFQMLIGGSKGFRHQRYQFFNGLIRLGDAPTRAKANYELAKLAFRNKDPYWGFRYLARSLHYMEDLGQPFHTFPILWHWIWDCGFSLKAITNLASNEHFYYEAFVTKQLLKQEEHGGGQWLDAIHDAEAADVFDPAAATEALGNYSYERTSKLIDACDHFFPKRVRSKKKIVPLRQEDLDPAEPPPSFGTINEITTLQLHVTSKMVRGLLALAKRDAMVVPKSEDE